MTRGNTILLVDSEAPAALDEADQLRGAGYTVIVSPTGEDALARTADNPVDLVLLEINLAGGMDGIQTAQEILKQRDIPILFFTSQAAAADSTEALAIAAEIDAYGCLPKPCARAVLLASIKMALRLHAQKQETAAANADLRQSVDRLHTMLESAPDTILHVDSQGIIRYVNQVKPGYTREQLVGSPIYAYVLPKSRPALAAALEAAFTGGERRNFEVRHPGPGGEIRDIEVHIVPFQGGGHASGALIFCMDITERKQAEAALQESQNRATAMLSAIPDMMFRLSRAGVFLDYKAEPKELVFQSDTLIGKTCWETLPSEFAGQLVQKIAATLDSGQMQVFEFQLPVPEQGLRDYEAHMVPSGADEVTTFVRDITERKQTETSLRASEAHLRASEATLRESQVRATAMLDAIPDLMFRLSREGIYLDYKAEKKDLIFQGASIIGQSLRGVTPPEFAEMYLGRIAAALDTGQMQIFEYRLDIPGLGPRDYEARLVASGPDETTSIVRDITERKQAEDELRASEARLRLATQVGRIGTYDYDYATGRGNWSPELKAFWGYPPDEEVILDNDKLIPGVHPDDRRRMAEDLAKSSDPAGDGALDTEFRVIDRQGSLHWLRVRGQAYFAGQSSERHPVKAYGAVIDITPRKQVQETLERALQEKGMLMRELQHRVKNSLNIAASLLYLEMDNLTDERSLAVLSDAQARIRSIAAVYEQLYQEGQVDQIELSEYIRNLLDQLISSYVHERRVKVETDLEPMPLDLKRALPLGLIINELITNALKYAFPTGRPGVIRVVLHHTETGAVLRVEDNGVGMNENAGASSGRMGLKLVDMLAQQINGSFGYENAGGVSAWVRF